MLFESDYKGFRIEVNAELADDAWNAQVRIRRTLSEETPHVEVITCRKPTGKVAEEPAVWEVRHGISRRPRARRAVAYGG